MNVKKYQIGDATQLVHEHNREESPEFFLKQLDIQDGHKDFIVETIINNTDVRIEMNDKEFKYEAKGDCVEVGMVKFLIDNEVDVAKKLIERNKFNQRLAILPFDQELKRMTTIRQVGERIVVYSKGAPEYLMTCCDQVLSTNFNLVSFRDSQDFLNGTISEMAGANGNDPLKVISLAYKEFETDEYNDLLAKFDNDPEQPGFREFVETKLIYIGTLGLNDDIRQNAMECVELIKFGKALHQFQSNPNDPEEDLPVISQEVNVRMISGDHIETCRQVAQRVGIITQDEMYEPGVVISAKEFRQEVGDIAEIWDPVTQENRIEFIKGRHLFDQVKKKCKVLARCTSEDKFMFVCGIKQKGGLVGMTGRSITDSEALKKADVGFCMGSGCDVAKDNSDLVVLDDDFESIHSSISWGRTIFDNVRKFLQFQLTINLVICFITIVGGSTTGNTPLNVI